MSEVVRPEQLSLAVAEVEAVGLGLDRPERVAPAGDVEARNRGQA
jgi:hypothetical protein